MTFLTLWLGSILALSLYALIDLAAPGKLAGIVTRVCYPVSNVLTAHSPVRWSPGLRVPMTPHGGAGRPPRRT